MDNSSSSEEVKEENIFRQESGEDAYGLSFRNVKANNRENMRSDFSFSPNKTEVPTLSLTEITMKFDAAFYQMYMDAYVDER